MDQVPEERPLERDPSDRPPDMPHAPASNSRIGLLGLLAALAVMAQLAAVLPRGAQGCFITNCPAGGRKRNALARSVGKRSGGLQQPVREVSAAHAMKSNHSLSATLSKNRKRRPSL